MGFLYPQFLFALFAVAIPIVIHLFNFRRFKRVYFTNVSLLKDLKTTSRKQNRLYDILLLCLRCLSIIFLVLLFAAPYIKDEDKALVDKRGNCVVVFVDNSFSMENSADKGSALSASFTTLIFKSTTLPSLNSTLSNHKESINTLFAFSALSETKTSSVLSLEKFSASKHFIVIADFTHGISEESVSVLFIEMKTSYTFFIVRGSLIKLFDIQDDSVVAVFLLKLRKNSGTVSSASVLFIYRKIKDKYDISVYDKVGHSDKFFTVINTEKFSFSLVCANLQKMNGRTLYNRKGASVQRINLSVVSVDFFKCKQNKTFFLSGYYTLSQKVCKADK